MLVVHTLNGVLGLLAFEPGLHVRYSAGPDADRSQTSRDYESGLELPGLAAIGLRPPRWWTRPTSDWVARQICKYAHLASEDPDRCAWLLVGRQVDRGPDNEPLLAEADLVARLDDAAITEARERYHKRFEVGRAH